MPVPGAWQDAFAGKETVALIPLVDGDAGAGAGWCTYPWGFDVPEVEVFCGGQNSKTPDAAAVWRQGFLMHFGFEPSPAHLNDAGKSLLVNAIAYAARCAEDRPIVRIVSPFRTRKRCAMPRETAGKYLVESTAIAAWFGGSTAAELAALPVDQRAQRFRELAPFLVTNAENKFEVDADLRAWKVGNRDAGLFDRCEEALRAGGEEAARAKAVLARYVPDGPGAGADGPAWTKWIAAHRAVLFCSDVGGFRWFVDALALSRGVPTTALRGVQRVAKARG